MDRLFPQSRVRHLVVVGLIALGVLFSLHSLSDYLTARDVAHNGDVARATCLAANRLTRAIRQVLTDGIRGARRAEMILPQFRAQYEHQIRQNQRYLNKLFVVGRC